MATNQDFNNLITRVDEATTQLELNVATLADSTTDVNQAVTEAKGYATDAKASKVNSEQSATTATQQATKATTEANRATQAVEDAKVLAPFNEAPKNGQTYGRKNGLWSIVESSGGGGGVGTVTSVNNVAQKKKGNVTINIPQPVEQVNADWNALSGKAQILNKPTIPSEQVNADWNALSGKAQILNKPTIPVVPTNVSSLNNDAGYLEDAPKDSKQYARKGGAWTEVVASGGGSNLGYATKEDDWYYDGVSGTNWLKQNPFEPIQLSKVASWVTGNYKIGAELMNAEGLIKIPSGRYWFTTTDFTVAPLQSTRGYIEVIEVPNSTSTTNIPKTVKAYTLNANNVILEEYRLDVDGKFTPLNMSPRRVGSERWNADNVKETLGIAELFTGMLWKGAFGASQSIVNKTNSITAPNSLPVGLYKFVDNTDIGGTSTTTPFQGRQGIILVLEFLPTIGATRTGATANKQILAMSWKGTIGSDIMFHVWTGHTQWISK